MPAPRPIIDDTSEEGSPPPAEPEAPASASPAEDSTAAQVLVVEDTPELAEMVVTTLRRVRISAEYELRGENALARYLALKPSVILLDLNLPDMPGWKVLEAIKDYSRENGVPGPRIIVMTAMGDPANRLVGKLQGVHGYIVKPCPAADLQATVRNALESAG